MSAILQVKVVLTSVAVLQKIHCGPMKFLAGNTFWNRWPCPSESRQASCSQKTSDAIFANDAAVIRDSEVDLGEADADGHGGEAEAAEGIVPFPHEHHMVLTQEWLHMFKSDVLVVGTPAAGASLKAALLSNVRAIAVARNVAHRQFLMGELEKFVKLHNLVPGYAQKPLPPILARYAAKHPQALRAAPGTPSQLPDVMPPGSPFQTPPRPASLWQGTPSPAPALSPAPTPSPAPAGGSTALAAFGTRVL
jgi:hypothetical protein